MSCDEKLLNYVIKSLKDAKDDNEKIATFFIIMKLDSNWLMNHKKFMDLYFAISPVFIHRLINSAKTNPNEDEIELGIQIFSYFINNEAILSRKETSLIIESCLHACSIVKKNKNLRECLTSVFNHCLDKPNLLEILKKNILKYFEFLESADDNESDKIIQNISVVFRNILEDHYFETLSSACEKINPLSSYKKLQFYDIVRFYLSNTKISSDFGKFKLENIIEYISHFLTSSKPLHNRGTLLMSLFLSKIPFEIFHKNLKERNIIDLCLNLSLVELELFLTKNEVNLSEIPAEIQSCMYIVEIFTSQIIYEILPSTYEKVLEFDLFLSQFIEDLDKKNSGEIFEILFRLVCFLHSHCANDINLAVITHFGKQFKYLTESDREINSIMIWVTPLLSNISECKLNDIFVMNDDILISISNILNLYSSKINENSDFINSEGFFNFLFGFYKFVSDDSIFSPLIENFINYVILFTNSDLVNNTDVLSLFYLLGTDLVIKWNDDEYIRRWIAHVKTQKLKNVLEYRTFSAIFLKDFVQLLLIAKKSNYVKFTFEDLQTILLNSRFFNKIELESQAEISRIIESYR